MNDKPYITQSDIRMIDYFMQEKGDIERWSSWNDRKQYILQEFPELENAMQQVKVAHKFQDLVVESIISREYEFPDE